MKHLTLFLAIALIVTSCSKDEPTQIILKTAQITLNFEDTYQIEATANEEIEYTSKDEFNATVDQDGLVTAGKVGETEIILKVGGESKKLNVIVEAKNYFYSDPILTFGISKKDVIKKLGKPSIEGSNAVLYDSYSNGVDNIMYSFENDKLKAVGVSVKKSYNYELLGYILERYELLSSDPIVFVNALTQNKVTMSIFITSLDAYSNFVVYFPYSSTKSANLNTKTLSDQFKELIK